MLPVTEAILERHLCLPCHPRMSDEDVVYVAAELIKSIEIAVISRGTK